MNNMRNIIIVAIAVVIGLAVAGYFGVKGCDCDCNGDKVSKVKKGDGNNADLKKEMTELKKQVSDLQRTLDGYADCLEKVCKKRKVTRKRRRRVRRRPQLVPLPNVDHGNSRESRDCRVVRVSGRTVYTRDCQGWQPLQFGPKRGDDRCPGIYYRRMGKNGTFTLSAQRLKENCRNFTLRRGSKWLVITPRSRLPTSNPSGEGLAYVVR